MKTMKNRTNDRWDQQLESKVFTEISFSSKLFTLTSAIQSEQTEHGLN